MFYDYNRLNFAWLQQDIMTMQQHYYTFNQLQDMTQSHQQIYALPRMQIKDEA